MKKKGVLISCVLLILTLVCCFLVYKTTKTDWGITLSDNGECKTISVDKEYDSYSFDDGLSWVDNKNYTVCDDSKVVVLAKKKSGNIVNYGTLDIKLTEKYTDDDLMFNSKTYSCKKGETIRTIVKGNVSFDNMNYNSSNENIAIIEKDNDMNLDCKDCVAVKINCYQTGFTDLKVKLIGIEAYSKVIVIDDVDTVGTISFDSSSYSCKKGETIKSLIEVSSSSSNVQVKSFSSSNTKIATVVEDNENNLECKNCKAVKINCIADGDVKISAVSTTGAKTTSSVSISDNIDAIGTISFDSSSYSCKKGETIEALIITNGTDINTRVDSFGSGNTNVANIVDNTLVVPQCVNCKAVKINCLSAGSTTLNAKSTTGATTLSNIVVSNTESDKGVIEFDKKAYTCIEGETIDAIVDASSINLSAYIKSFESENDSLVQIIENTDIVPECTNCKAVKINCIKQGSTSLVAVSTTGAKTQSSIKISSLPSSSSTTARFEKNSYTCNLGESVYIKKIGNSKTINISDTKLASLSNTIVRDKDGSVSFVVNCLDLGNVTLSLDNKAKASLTIKSDTTKAGKIKFDKSSYSCKKGGKVEAIVSPEVNSSPYLSSYVSSSTKVASIESVDYKTIGGRVIAYININCISNGNVTINAQSTTGAKATSSLSVSGQRDIASFDKSGYIGESGKSVIASFTYNTSGSSISYYWSSNASVANVEPNTEQPNCIGCLYIKVSCLKPGYAKVNVKMNSGAVISSVITCTKSIDTKGTVTFDKSSYTCESGKTIKATISAISNDLKTSIKSYSSSNTSVATIEKHPEEVANCLGCEIVQIKCHKKGNVTLNAVSSTGAKTTASVNVDGDSITFDKSNFVCEKGKTFTTLLKATGSNMPKIKSYSSSDTKIASISLSTMQPNCIGCSNLVINCKSSGKVTLNAETTSGVKTSAEVNVIDSSIVQSAQFDNTVVHSVAFDKSNYYCKKGMVIYASIYVTSNDPLTSHPGILYYKSSDTSIATLTDSNIKPNCLGCEGININCLKEGSVTLEAAAKKIIQDGDNIKIVSGASTKAEVIVDDSLDLPSKLSSSIGNSFIVRKIKNYIDLIRN